MEVPLLQRGSGSVLSQLFSLGRSQCHLRLDNMLYPLVSNIRFLGYYVV